MDEMKFNDQIALVTGASRGIGKAIAESLGKAGAFVIGTATTESGSQSIKDNFNALGISGTAYQLDVADKASIERLGTSLNEDGFTPVILVNNAGITRDNLLMRMKDDEWDAVIETNLGSVFHLSRLCLRGMMKARYGRIINISSVVASAGNPGQSNYAAAKAGMTGFTRSLAREVGSRGITVNAVAPGFIETDMTDKLPEEQREALLSQITLNRLGSAEEIASVVLFLASSRAGYITGETVHVNGGMYMG